MLSTAADCSATFFGYAEGYDEERKSYTGLCTTQPPSSVVIGETLLVKSDVAMAQASAAQPTGSGQPSPPSSKPSEGTPAPTGPGNGGSTEPTPQPAAKTRFYGSIEISPQKVSSSVQKVVDEVTQHLSSKYGSQLKISLEIEAENDNGFDENTVRIVSENANTLGFKEKGFE